MISTDFAPNESLADAWLSFKLLFQPWRWQKGKEIEQAKKNLLKQFPNQFLISFFLTGRAALNTILKSLNLSEGSEVIVQAFTCEAVILPIFANQLKPVYVDIEKQTYSMNPIDLEKKITSKAKVLILQHSFGMMPIHRDRIFSLVKKHHLLLIEDIAHWYSKKLISNFKFQISNSLFLMSFGRSKALSSVFGGAIITNNQALINKLSNQEALLPLPSMFFIFRLLLYKPISLLIKSTYDLYIGKMLHKFVNWFNLLVPEITLKEKAGEYDQILNKAYPNALAILINQQLARFEQVQQNRARISAFYSNFQFPVSKLVSSHQQLISNLPLLRYPVLVNNRDLILKKAAKNNIFLGKWYDQVVAPKSLNLEKVGYKQGSCTVAEEVCKKIINLPTNISLREAKICVLSFLRSR